MFVRDKMFDNVIMKAVTRGRRQSLLTSHLSSIYLFTCLELRSLEFFFEIFLKFLERKGIGKFCSSLWGGGVVVKGSFENFHKFIHLYIVHNEEDGEMHVFKYI